MTVEAPTDDSTPDLGDDTANAFLSNLLDQDDKEEAPEGDPEPAEGEPAADAEPAEADPDDAEVDVGEAKAKLRDLKAAYTAKGDTDRLAAETASVRTKADADALRVTAAMNRAMEKADARWAPYAKLDFLALSRDPTIDQATFLALRTEAQEALNDVKFVREELDGVVAAQRTEAQAQTNAQAAASVKSLSDPTSGIPGFGPALYNEMLAYAETAGAPKGVPQSIVADWALRALHKAMLYDRGVAATATKLEKVIAKPSRVLQSKGSSTGAAASSTKAAMEALRKSGSVDDAADAFYASVSD